MTKGAVLDEKFISALGLSEQLLTLTRNIESKHHDILQEALFHIHVDEVKEPIYLERKYVFDNQLSLRTNYGKGEKILLWVHRVRRINPHSETKETIELLMVRDGFLLGDWREFQRFKLFVRSMRILDAQARSYLSAHHQEFPSMVNDAAALERILVQLQNIAEWPDLEQSGRTQSSLENIAKTYSPSLAPVRACALMPRLLLRRAPDVRFNLFRLFSFVEDPTNGANALVRFLSAVGAATNDAETIATTSVMTSGVDIQRAFSCIKQYLISTKTPGK
jgi:hypothetical protein